MCVDMHKLNYIQIHVYMKYLQLFTVCPRYNAPHYNVDAAITWSIMAPEFLVVIWTIL